MTSNLLFFSSKPKLHNSSVHNQRDLMHAFNLFSLTPQLDGEKKGASGNGNVLANGKGKQEVSATPHALKRGPSR